MIGKKDNHDIFKQYKQVLLEQIEENNISSLINRIKVSSLDGKTKSEILDLLSDKTVQDVYKIVSLKKNSGFMDQDTANLQDPKFAEDLAKQRKIYQDQDDQDTANKPDPKFAEELAKARKEQQEKYPEKEESEESLAVADIKKELNAAIASGDQKRANELFDELRKYGTSIKRAPSSANLNPSARPSPSAQPSPDWHKKATPAMATFSQGAQGKIP